MTLNLVDYDQKTRIAVRTFWRARDTARRNQMASGRVDQGERSGVTSGKNMDGFLNLIQEVVMANGLPHAQIYHNRALLTLPGFFRPTKRWDTLIFYRSELIAAIELKSHVGPSFGNNFNNRVEEAIGAAHDLWTAYREGAFGDQPRLFCGWLILVEDAVGSRSLVRCASPHFPLFEEFKEASYLQRYDLLCQKLVREQLYTTATLIASPREGGGTGEFSELSTLSGLRTFVTALAAHVAAEAARLGED